MSRFRAQVAAFALLFLCVACGGETRPYPRFSLELRPGAVITGEPFDEAEGHEYLLELQSRDILHLELEQQRLDVYSQLLDPADRTVFEQIDFPTGDQGVEPVCFVAEESGEYRLRVRPFEPRKGQYRIRVVRYAQGSGDGFGCEQGLRAFLRASDTGREIETRVNEYQRAARAWQDPSTAFAQSVALRQRALLQPSGSETSSGALEEARERRRGQLEEARDVAQRTPYCGQVAYILNDLGELERDAERPRFAAELFERARTVALACGDEGSEASALTRLGNVYRDLGQFERSRAAYAAAAKIRQERKEQCHQGSLKTQRAVLEMILGRDREAERLLNEALKVQRLANCSIAETLMQLGWLHHLTDRRPEALDCLQQARDRYRNAGDRLGEAAALDRLGTVEREAGHWEAAETSYRAAFERLRSDPRRRMIVEANLGFLAEARGDAAEALAILEPLKPKLEPLDRTALGRLLLSTAEARRQQGDYPGAARDFEAALQIFQQLREQPRNPRQRLDFLAVRQDYYQQYLDFLLERHRAEPNKGWDARAFRIQEEARARTLLDLLHESGVDWRQDVPGALLERERDILARLGSDPNAWDQLQRLHGEMRAASPSFAALARPEVVGLEALRESLDSETVLLAFRLGESRSDLWLVRDDGAEIYTLPSRTELEAEARSFHENLLASNRPSSRKRSDYHAHELYRLLFDDVSSERLDRTRWWILADGWLHRVPFAALRASPGGEPLVREREIAMLPSASVWQALRQRSAARPLADRGLLVVADPIFSAEDSRLTSVPIGTEPSRRVDETSGGSDWPRDRLKFTGEEAQSLLALAEPSRSLALRGFDATRRGVLQAGLDRFRILHFATHSWVDPEEPTRSSILLSVHDGTSWLEGDRLHMEDIYALRLSADLVVLSACSTALGHQVRGEGPLSLSRAFLQAGASGVVVSLWNVLDQSTARLMERFYRALLNEGHSPPAALRLAQLHLLEESEIDEPRLWAPFVFQGDPTVRP